MTLYFSVKQLTKKVERLKQTKRIWFKTDLGYEATKRNIRKDKEKFIIIGASKGRFTFHFKEFADYTIQITKYGSLGIYYPDSFDYNFIFEKIKPFLSTPEGKLVTQFEVTSKDSQGKSKQEEDKKLKTKIRKAIRKFQFLLLRNPSTEEVAYAVGKPPEVIRETTYSLSPKTGWKEPTTKEMEESDRKLSEVYAMAALLKHFKSDVVVKRPAMFLGGQPINKVLERAKYALRFESDRLPKVVLVKEDEKTIEFKFKWAAGSKYNLWGMPEYYDKENKKLGGQIGAYKKAWDVIRKQIEDIVDDEKT